MDILRVSYNHLKMNILKKVNPNQINKFIIIFKIMQPNIENHFIEPPASFTARAKNEPFRCHIYS